MPRLGSAGPEPSIAKSASIRSKVIEHKQTEAEVYPGLIKEADQIDERWAHNRSLP
jgi:hypothetical protein